MSDAVALVSSGLGDILAETFGIYIGDLLRLIGTVLVILPVISCGLPGLQMMNREFEGG